MRAIKTLVGPFFSVLLLVTLVLLDLYHRLESNENLSHHPLLHFDFQPLSSATTNQYYPPSGQTIPKETFHQFRSTVELRQTKVLDHRSIWRSTVACDWTDKDEDLERVALTITKVSGLQYSPTLILFAEEILLFFPIRGLLKVVNLLPMTKPAAKIFLNS